MISTCPSTAAPADISIALAKHHRPSYLVIVPHHTLSTLLALTISEASRSKLNGFHDLTPLAQLRSIRSTIGLIACRFVAQRK